MIGAGGLTLVVCLLSVWTCLSVRRDQAAGRAVAAVIVICTLVPVMSVRDETSAVCAMATVIAVCIIARVRSDAQVSASAWTRTGVVIAFAAWLAARIVGQFSPRSEFLQIGMLATIAALALVMPLLRRTDLRVLADVVLVLVVVHTVYGALEQSGTVGAVWDLRQKSLETIEYRANILLPWLAGRSQSSFGHPILFATFACFAVLVLTHAGLRERRRRYAVGAVVGLVALGLSGTRSAAVALIVALVAYALTNIRWRRLFGFVIGTGAVGIAALLVNLPQLLALDSRFESSVSYIHRSLVAGSWAALWAQDDVVKWLGHGAGAIAELFRSGIVRGASKLLYFDNAFISLFALSGLVALLLFCASLLGSLHGGSLAIAVATVVATMGFSFDEQQWQLALLMLAFGSLLPGTLGGLHRRDDPPAPDPPSDQAGLAPTRRARRAMTA